MRIQLFTNKYLDLEEKQAIQSKRKHNFIKQKKKKKHNFTVCKKEKTLLPAIVLYD